jgi:TolB-like protein
MAAGRTRLGPYTIIGPLGSGGMGVVYRAHDARLQRDVAIKVLPLDRLADAAAMARIVRESRLVAALEHPSIITIHDVGEEDGQFYLVTELIEGETLRARLQRGGLALREVLDVTTAIAAALDAAHARGVVHRDLKPENVMITVSGAVKVLDFGVAKFVAPAGAATEAAQTALTNQGGIVGTPAYMAPEQLEGRDVDHRADQFALGVLIYEMLTGVRPFAGATTAELSASILRDEPRHLSAVRADVPVPLARIVTRCLAKDPNGRYASTTDLAHAISDTRADLALLTPASTVMPARRNRAIAWGAAALALAAIAAVGMFPRQQSIPGSVASSGGVSRAVAVLPFASLGNVDAYLADGITEAVTRELGHIEGTRVIASSAAFAYRGRSEGLSQIARELGVEVMVRGSVQRNADRLRITAALLNTADDTTLWSNHYDRDANDILAVEDDIAWQVAAKLAAALGAQAPARPPATPKTTPEAYDAFLRGLSHMRGPASEYGDGVTDLERAVSLDPNFSLGHARLASAYTQQFFYNSSDPALERKAFVEIEKALATNPDLAEAYLARAQLTWNLRNGFPHERAIADLRRAIENNPNLAEAHVELGKLYLHIGLIDKSIAANTEALRLEPRSTAAVQRLVGAKIDGGMAQQLNEELARNPQWSLRSRSTTLAFLRRTDEAIAAIAPRGIGTEELKKLDMNDVALLANLVARRGQRADAERALAIAIPLAANPTGLSDTHHAQFFIGCAYALLGHDELAVRWITKAANEGYPSYPRFSSEADIARLKGNPAFDALLARLQKDYERWRTSL